MNNLKELNIWKTEERQNNSNHMFLDTDISELNLSVRSYNCLKRAQCSTVRDIMSQIGEDGQGLKRIRNLGNRSEAEIMSRLQEHREYCSVQKKESGTKKVSIIKPAKKIWDMEIEEFHLSNYALKRLKSCGINQIKDLYATNPKNEPGWYAVRELFEKIPVSHT